MPPELICQTAVLTVASQVYLLPGAGVLDDCDFGGLLLVRRHTAGGSRRILFCVFTVTVHGIKKSRNFFRFLFSVFPSFGIVVVLFNTLGCTNLISSALQSDET
ncbi:hypothetical protein IEQ34_000970 [Dendrobium chrysotoxum]|uniref:Uncharacterized protein n=1 Tax=Dendrobium chrysotoxum TaxID=161865 RepID=A0AAV7HNY9_DENCH|nr:hypothetical protein IEQ34_000970 [Dendrobium chrysotoxum]